MREKNDYVKRQVDILSNLGIFYLIILALFAIPLCGAFVVVIINGVMELKHVIWGVAGLGMVIILVLAVQFFRKWVQRLKSDGMSTYRDASQTMNRGEPVQISMLNGLITFSYGRDRYTGALPYHAGSNTLLLPEAPESPPQPQPADIVSGLKDLVELKHQGVIDEEEFKALKTRLIREPDDVQGPQPPAPPGCENKINTE